MVNLRTIVLVAAIGGCSELAPSESVAFLKSFSFSPSLEASLAYPDFLRDPRTAQAYRQAGLEARQRGDFDGAIETFKRAVALAPKTVSGYVLLGWTQHLAGQGEAAIASLNQGLLRDEAYIPGLNALGIVYLVNGDVDQAIAIHTQAKTLKPDNEIAYYNLSLAYQLRPDITAAIDHAHRATELEPYNPHPWVALALAHWSDSDRDAARAAYEKALGLDQRYLYRDHLDHLSQAGFSSAQIQKVDEIRLTVP